MSIPQGPFEKAWRDLRFRRRLFWGLFAGYLPFGAAVAALISYAGYLPDAKLALVLVPYMAVWAGSGMWMSFFLCPRCTSPFFRRGGMQLFVYHNPYASACLGCNLPIYCKVDPGETPRQLPVRGRPRTVRIFRIVDMPMIAVNVVIGFCLLLWSKGSIPDNPVPDHLIVWFTLSNGFSTFICFMTLNSIRGPRIHEEMGRLREGGFKLLLSGTLAVAALCGLFALLSYDLSDPNIIGHVFSRPPGFLIVACSLILSSTLLFFTRDVCARIFPD